MPRRTRFANPLRQILSTLYAYSSCAVLRLCGSTQCHAHTVPHSCHGIRGCHGATPTRFHTVATVFAVVTVLRHATPRGCHGATPTRFHTVATVFAVVTVLRHATRLSRCHATRFHTVATVFAVVTVLRHATPRHTVSHSATPLNTLRHTVATVATVATPRHVSLPANNVECLLSHTLH